MMRGRTGPLAATLLLAFAVVVSGCGVAAERGPRIQGLTPEELGRLGARIHENPARAERYLREAGLTSSEFEKAVRDVSAESDLARRYREAFDRERDSLTS